MADHTGTHLDRRLESVEPANCFVTLLLLELVNAFEALEAIPRDVLTEFFAIFLTSFPIKAEGRAEQRQGKKVEIGSREIRNWQEIAVGARKK